ncbi:trichohyalin isoform X3 [Haplochromis burtoni]|uniref:trichohyalin isoform X3 n=1 Tax=Haplochromis burtoni TaxID=8153 RepID=UPI0006C9B5CE|nr:trichohyalin isoform X3 [Haplochromis burtoni]
MGTKRPSWTLFDTLTKTSRSDHKLQPGGKIPLDSSPRPAMTGWFKRELERTAKKGDTFPRMKKGLTSPDRRLCTEMDEERGERRWNDRPPKKAETDVWGQERERTFQVEKERYEGRRREKDEGKPTGRGYIEDEKLRQRGRYQELSDIRFQDGRREVDESWDRRMVDQIGGVERSDTNLETHHELVDDITQQPQKDLLQRSCRNDEHPMINNWDTGSEHKVQREERLSTEEATESKIHSRAPSAVHNLKYRKEMRRKVKQSYSEMGRKDSKTERLLQEWREKTKEPTDKKEMQTPISQSAIDQLQPILDQINTTGMSPEEVEAIRIRLSGTWSVSEEPKRHSQAPHLKWAKNVVREILGHSEEEPSTEAQEDQPAANQTETSNAKPQEEVAEETREVPAIKLSMEEDDLEPELEELFDARGMGQSQAHMHADQFTAMHVVTHTHTHADTALESERKEDCSMDKTTLEPSGEVQLGKSDIKVTVSETEDDEVNLKESEKEKLREKEAEMYLSANNTLYKPNSCPILYHDCESELLCPSSEGESQGVDYGRDESEEERQGREPEDRVNAVDVIVPELTEVNCVEAEGQVGNLESSYSSQKLGSKVPSRRKGVHKTTQRRNVDVEEDEGVGRDRRTRVFYATDDEDDRSKSLSEMGLRNLLGTIERQKSNSRFYNAAQLYQQYSEAAQNSEILRQARSEFLSVSEDQTSSPLPSPPPARRALPPIPPQPHAQSFSHTGSVSIQSLHLPECPRGERRASSPRLSISQSSSLWRDLPGVRNSAELDELTEDQRRLQEVRFEVITSEASYCRSLEIVVDHFVKSKQLGAQLTTQDKNWLFSRLVDVRAISHSFLSKLEERVESDVMHFTVCDIIYRQCPLFRKAYVPYLTNQSYQDATYQRLMNENPRFKMIVEKIEKSAVCQRLPLRSFLVLPFQRITRLKLLVQNIVKRTTRGTAEATQAIKALKQLEKIIQQGNDSISQMKSIESLVSLSAKVDFECKTLPLISQSRRMVREGPVTQLMDFSLKETEKNAYLHLFNDYLLLSLPKEGGRFTVIDHCPVSELRVENCRVKLHSLQKNLFRLYMAQKSLLLRTDAPSDKLRWISALSRPHTEVDFSSAQDFEQMQCIRAFFAQQPDELSLEKADVILVHQESSDNWVEGTKLSDRQRGWVPKSHLETIASSRVKSHNLSDALKLTAATATA